MLHALAGAKQTLPAVCISSPCNGSILSLPLQSGVVAVSLANQLSVLDTLYETHGGEWPQLLSHDQQGQVYGGCG